MGTQMTQLTYLIAIVKLKASESSNFLDIKSLSCVDLDKLFEDVDSNTKCNTV